MEWVGLRNSRRLLLACVLLAGAAPLQTRGAAPAFADGQQIEVREGDSWSSATILRHEGRKYQVHYQGADPSADEWVTADRMRSAGAGATTKPATAGAPLGDGGASTPRPTTKPVVWNIHQQVEVKWGGTWFKSSIVNKRGEWLLISYDGWSTREWVEPWRIRKLGSTEDPIGSARPNPTVRKGEGPPGDKPGLPPESNRFADNKPDAAEAEHTPLTETDRSGARELALGGDLQAQPVPPNPAPKLTAPLTRQAMSLTKAASVFDRLSSLLPAAGGAPMLAVVRTDGDPRGSGGTRIERINLTSGQAVGTTSLHGENVPLALSNDGKLLATHPNTFGRQDGQSRLDIWALDATGESKPLISFAPCTDRQQGFRNIGHAAFIAADHLLVESSWGGLSLWEFRKARCVWTAKSDAGFAVSPGGKYLAVKTRDNIAVLEALTGKMVSMLDTGGGVISCISFSPDSASLAAAGPDLLLVWDLATGQPRYLSPVGISGWAIDWPAAGWILVDHQKLVSLEKQITIWSYAMPPGQSAELGCVIGGRLWYPVSEAHQGGTLLCSISVPADSVQQAAQTVDTDSLMVIRPGLRVSLDVNVPGDSRDKIIAELKAKLKANGIGVFDGQPIKLVARVEPGDTHEMEYSPFGGGFNAPRTKMNVQDIKAVLAYQGADGKSLWQRVAITSAPGMLTMKQGQSVQDAVTQSMKPPLALFESARIPGYVPKDPAGLGTSRLTASGVAAEHP